MKSATATLTILGLATAMYLTAADSSTVKVKGFVLDSACAFTKGLTKPASKQCAIDCAKGGSDSMPAIGQNAKLLPFAGDFVTATGKIYQRGGSKAIAIEKIELQAAPNRK